MSYELSPWYNDGSDEWYHESDLPNFDEMRSDLERAYRAIFVTGDIDQLIDALEDVSGMLKTAPECRFNEPMICSLKLPEVVNG